MKQLAGSIAYHEAKCNLRVSPTTRCGTRASRTLRTGLFAVLAAIAPACSGERISAILQCEQPAPDSGIEGIWRGQVSSRELVITLKQECSALNFHTYWAIVGTWDWGSGSSGTASFIWPNIYLKGNEGGTFRGLTISLNEAAPLGGIITGLATGELPATASSSGSWVAIIDQSVTLERQ